LRNRRSISARVKGREPRRPKIAIWPPVSSTARSRSRPLDSESAGLGVGPGDELGLGRRREAVEVGLAVERGQLQHLHPVPAVRDIGEQRGVGGADDHVLDVVHLPVEGDLLVEARRSGLVMSTITRPVLLAAT
jgi:hypothetical protein